MMARRRAAARETVVRAGVVDVFVVRPVARGWRHLVLRRARGVRCPGTWEAVHGHVERGETPPGSGALLGHAPLAEVIERFGR